MPYLVKRILPKGDEPSLDQLLSGSAAQSGHHRSVSYPTTVTRLVSSSADVYTPQDIRRFVSHLTAFNQRFSAQFFASDAYKAKFYRHFRIPKAQGGFREIYAPFGELKNAQQELRSILSSIAPASHHAAAFAYAEGRSIKQCISRHQANKSKWFLKLDLADFFGSTTKPFVLRQLSQLVPFNRIMQDAVGEKALSKALDCCFLHGKLLQGTCISPMLTNLIMIPFDYRLTKALHPQRYVYTRYADDMLISSSQGFEPRRIVSLVDTMLRRVEAPYQLKTQKTRYGSSSGRNFNLGLMLNKDNRITIGHEKHKLLKAKLTHFVLDTKNGSPWSRDKVEQLMGELAYYRCIEPNNAEHVILHLGRKFGVDVNALLKRQASASK